MKSNGTIYKLDNNKKLHPFQNTSFARTTVDGNKEQINKILIPFDTSIKRKNKLIEEGYVLETLFDIDNKIKKVAFEKKIKYCLINNRVISTR